MASRSFARALSIAGFRLADDPLNTMAEEYVKTSTTVPVGSTNSISSSVLLRTKTE